MSRGPGVIQRTIIETVTELGPCPLMWIAEQAGYDTTKLAVRQSFTRAGNGLYDRDAVKLWVVRWPSKVTLVSGADTDPSEGEIGLARLRHLETYTGDDGDSTGLRFAAAVSKAPTEAQKLIVADTVRINRRREAEWRSTRAG